MQREETKARERESVTRREILDRFGEETTVLYTRCGHRVTRSVRDLLETQEGLRQLQSMFLDTIVEVLESSVKCPACR
ncbi:MAG: hypothetical protein WC080_03745 [Patescibacteria group bacterium]